MSLVNICCQCGRWYLGTRCLGRPCQKIIHTVEEGCKDIYCEHIFCSNCGTGKLNPREKQILVAPSHTKKAK